MVVFQVNSHTSATRTGWHLREIDLRFATGLPPGWCRNRSTPAHPTLPPPPPSTLDPRPLTLNPQPSTLNPQSSTLNPQPPALNPHPSTHLPLREPLSCVPSVLEGHMVGKKQSHQDKCLVLTESDLGYITRRTLHRILRRI